MPISTGSASAATGKDGLLLLIMVACLTMVGMGIAEFKLRETSGFLDFGNWLRLLVMIGVCPTRNGWGEFRPWLKIVERFWLDSRSRL